MARGIGRKGIGQSGEDKQRRNSCGQVDLMLELSSVSQYRSRLMAIEIMNDMLSLNFLEVLYTGGLILLSLLLRAVVGKGGSLMEWVSSLLQTPVDLAFAAISFLLATLLGHGYDQSETTHVIPVFIVLLTFVYWMQHCSQEQLNTGSYRKMAAQLILGLTISAIMLMYAMFKVSQTGLTP